LHSQGIPLRRCSPAQNRRLYQDGSRTPIRCRSRSAIKSHAYPAVTEWTFLYSATLLRPDDRTFRHSLAASRPAPTAHRPASLPLLCLALPSWLPSGSILALAVVRVPAPSLSNLPQGAATIPCRENSYTSPTLGGTQLPSFDRPQDVGRNLRNPPCLTPPPGPKGTVGTVPRGGVLGAGGAGPCGDPD
jgi:hypothetical protein